VCDLKMSHIGESPQLVSVYTRGEWPSRVCSRGYPLLWTGESLEKHIYHARDAAVQPGGSGLGRGSNDIYFLSLENDNLIN